LNIPLSTAVQHPEESLPQFSHQKAKAAHDFMAFLKNVVGGEIMDYGTAVVVED